MVYRTLYRVCRNHPPVDADFWSHAARGIVVRRPNARAIDLSRGVSMWDSQQRARDLALRFPETGAYIAEIEVPGNVRQERSGNGHWTVWASADQMRRWVVRVVPVR